MSKKLKIVVTDYIETDLDWEVQEMAKRGHQFEYHQLKGAPESEVIAATRDADVVVVNMVKITPAVVDAWENVKVVIRHGAGYDNCDVAALTAKGILLEYVPDYCVHEVAEHAIALMFACARKVVWGRQVFDDSVARGEWDFKPIIPMFRMDGATIGLVGCGRIGGLVYKKLQHFGVKFLICDPYLSEKRRAELGVELVDLETVMRNSDLITVHTPLNDETRYIINRETLAMMKPTAYLVNTSRGGMVNADDLAEALKKRQIAGAAIDVFEKEPPDPDYPLIGLDNVILAPHLAWYSEDAGWTIREKIVQAIDMFANDEGPRMPINHKELQARKES
jgi:D-3-phosphoglycerate dehydrogenase